MAVATGIAVCGEQHIAKGAVALIVDKHGQLAAFPYHLKLRDRPENAPSDDLPGLDEFVDTWIVDAYRKLEKERTAADAAGKERG